MPIEKQPDFADIFSPEAVEIVHQAGLDGMRLASLEQIGSVPLRELLSYWNRCRDGMPLPHVNQLDPIAIPRHLSNAYLFDVAYDPMKFRVRIMGDQIVTAVGQNAMGEEISSIVALGVPYGKMLHELYAWIVAQRRPIVTRGPNPTLSDGYVSEEYIYLPFVDTASRIARILGGVVYSRK